MGQNESKSLICFAQNNSEIRFWPEKKWQYSNFALQILYRKKKLATKIAILAFFLWSEFFFREIWLRIFRHFLKSCLFPTKKVTKKGHFFPRCQKIRSQFSRKKNSDQNEKWQYSVFWKKGIYSVQNLQHENTILSLFVLVRNEFPKCFQCAFSSVKKTLLKTFRKFISDQRKKDSIVFSCCKFCTE